MVGAFMPVESLSAGQSIEGERMNRGVLIGGAIAFAIFVVVYLVVTAVTGSIGGAQIAIALGGGVVCGLVGLGIGMVMARRGPTPGA